MNLTGEKTNVTAAAEHSLAGRRRLTWYLTTVLFPVFVVLSYGGMLGRQPELTAMLISTVLYFAAVYFFYGIAELACEGRTYLLWVTAVAAYVLGFLVTGLELAWPMITGCSMFLFGGAIVGRLCTQGRRPGRAYLLGAATVMLFFTAQFIGLWGLFMEETRALIPEVLTQLEPVYRSLGATPEAIQDDLAVVERMLTVLVRLIPALTLLGALAEFSLGFLVFAHVVSRRRPWQEFWPPFRSWRAPFAFTPVVAVTILARLLGNETVQLVSDNILAIFAVYYSVAGLALIEYYMNRFALSVWLRVSFYLLLTLTPFVNPRPLTAAAVFGTLMLLGFVDSFADWRRERPAAEAT